MDYVTLEDGNRIVIVKLPSGHRRPIQKGTRYPWGTGQYPGVDSSTAEEFLKIDLQYFRDRGCFKVESEVEKTASDFVKKVVGSVKAKGKTKKKGLVERLKGGK